MTELTGSARAAWAHYLDAVRAHQSGRSEDELAEVMEGLEDHLASELADVHSPADEPAVRAVIAQLGAPERWEFSGAHDSAHTSAPPADDALVAPSTRPVSALLLAAGVSLVAGLLAPDFLWLGVLMSTGFAVAVLRERDADRLYRRAALALAAPGLGAVAIIALLWPLALVLPVGATGGVLEALVQPETLARWGAGTGRWWATLWGTGALLTAASGACLARAARPLAAACSWLGIGLGNKGARRVRRVLRTAAGVALAGAAAAFALALILR